MKIKVGIVGAGGRMGQAISSLILLHDHMRLVGGLERAGHEMIGTKIGSATVTDDVAKLFDMADVVIDFSSPAASLIFAQHAADTKKAMVIGTTGLSDEQKKSLEKIAQKVPMVVSSNMSLGVNVLAGLVKKASVLLGDDFDAEILEMHHHHKIDAPSGTALMLGAATGRPALPMDRDGKREKGKVGYAVLRGGDVAGTHDVIFAGQGEQLVFSHRAHDRQIFARGAVRAAQWVATQKPGFYSMMDVLGL